MVTIETAEVPLSAQDKIFVFSEALDDQHLRLLALLSEDFFANKQNLDDLVNDLFVDKDCLPIVLLAEIGPESIYLNKIAS
jgi:hypothetical protein